MENWFVPHFDSMLPKARRVMVLAPHPDDEVFGCAGALLHCLRSGAVVEVLVFTDGCAHLEGQAKEEMKALREQESCVAAQRMGCPEPRFLGFEDRKLSEVSGLEELIGAHIEAFEPDLLFLPSVWEIHPDHRALCLATLEAVKEGQYHFKSELILMQYEIGSPMVPNFILDITDVKETKDAAVQAFGSQLKVKPYDRCIKGLNQYRALTLHPKACRAEAFWLLPAKDLAAWLVGLRPNEAPDFVFSMQGALASAHQENLLLTQELNDLKASSGHWGQEVEFLRSKLESLEQKAFHHQQLFDAVQDSWSWRVTKPLRGLGRLTRWIKAKLIRPLQ